MARIEDPSMPEAPLRSASEYSQRAAQQRKALDQSKAARRPLGGAPPIPPGKLAALTQMPQPSFEDEAPMPQATARAPLMPQEPPPVGGMGSAYAVNQAMARGEVDRPVSVAGARKMAVEKKALSAETQKLLELQQQQQEVQEGEDSRKQHLDESEGDIADENKVDINLETLDAIAGVRNDLIWNDDRRKEIEKRLEELNIADLVTRREIQQDIPVIPGKLKYRLRTLNESENLFCLQYVYEFTGSNRYVEELFNMARLVCGLVSLNDRHLPDHRKDVGTLNEKVARDLFEKKFKMVTLYPVSMVADLGAQYQWFMNRVNALFSVETLKNG